MSNFVQEAKEVLKGFGINLPEDQPWVVEPEYRESSQFLIHLLNHQRGLGMEYKGDPISWFIPHAEKHFARCGIDVDFSKILNEHQETEEFYIWLADIRDYFKDHGMVFLYLDGLDDLMFFEVLPDSEAAKLQDNSFFRKLVRETDSFLNPDNWGTWIVEDA